MVNHGSDVATTNGRWLMIVINWSFYHKRCVVNSWVVWVCNGIGMYGNNPETKYALLFLVRFFQYWVSSEHSQYLEMCWSQPIFFSNVRLAFISSIASCTLALHLRRSTANLSVLDFFPPANLGKDWNLSIHFQSIPHVKLPQDPNALLRVRVAGQSICTSRLATGLHPMQRALQDADAVGALVSRTPQHGTRRHLWKLRLQQTATGPTWTHWNSRSMTQWPET